jgi:DNA-binding beta-propeller fold protein YncE
VTLVSTGLQNPRGITIDPATQTLYWTDNFTDRIERAASDGSGRTTVLSNIPLDGIVYNPEDQFIYWADFVAPGQIERARGDGTQVQTVVSGLKNPRSVAVATVPEPTSTCTAFGMAIAALTVSRRHPVRARVLATAPISQFS